MNLKKNTCIFIFPRYITLEFKGDPMKNIVYNAFYWRWRTM